MRGCRFLQHNQSAVFILNRVLSSPIVSYREWKEARKGKLEFRDAEDDVGQNERDMLEREKRLETGGGKRIQERNRGRRE